jgi:hypothetical protein
LRQLEIIGFYRDAFILEIATLQSKATWLQKQTFAMSWNAVSSDFAEFAKKLWFEL